MKVNMVSNTRLAFKKVDSHEVDRTRVSISQFTNIRTGFTILALAS